MDSNLLDVKPTIALRLPRIGGRLTELQMKSFAFPIYIGELNQTPVGDLRLAASDAGLVALEWAHSQPDFDSYLHSADTDVIAPYADELREYLEGSRRAFTFPIDWSIFRHFQNKALQK